MPTPQTFPALTGLTRATKVRRDVASAAPAAAVATAAPLVVSVCPVAHDCKTCQLKRALQGRDASSNRLRCVLSPAWPEGPIAPSLALWAGSSVALLV